jgi:SagB-type dehydrogenase family enzyme
MGQALAWGAAGAALLKSARMKAAGLPSDPGTAVEPGPDEIALPAFDKTAGFTLEQALLARKSRRSFDPAQPLSREELSRLLWAMTGVNRPDGHRTTPSALARYPVDVLVALPEGVYEYKPDKHILARVFGEDLRGDVGLQPNFKNAGMIALYLINKSRFQGEENPWADLEIGCMVQDLYLMAAALDLGSCVFALVKYDKVAKALGLKDRQVLRIAQAVGKVKQG